MVNSDYFENFLTKNTCSGFSKKSYLSKYENMESKCQNMEWRMIPTYLDFINVLEWGLNIATCSKNPKMNTEHYRTWKITCRNFLKHWKKMQDNSELWTNVAWFYSHS